MTSGLQARVGLPGALDAAPHFVAWPKPTSGFISLPAYCTAATVSDRAARACGVGRHSRPILDLNPLERARTERKFAPGFLVRSTPKLRRVVGRVGP